MAVDRARLLEAVRTNCDLADARHAREATLCNYLLAMRELFRWEQDLPLSHPLPAGELSAWIARREARWDALAGRAFLPLPVGGGCDPFDEEAINAHLLPAGLVYSGGLGRWGQAQFFLGELARREMRLGNEVLVAGREHARGLFAPPAARRGDRIVLRMDALRRWLWEKTEVWGIKRADGALKSALEGYAFAAGPEAALERMTASESETLILHEIGEAMAEPLLGADWRSMVLGLANRRAELLVRALRDHLADCLSTLPALLERGAAPAVHFYFANFDGLRRSLFPRLAEAYAVWRERGEDAALRAACLDGRAHWAGAAQQALARWRAAPGAAAATLSAWVDAPGPLRL